MFSLPDRPMSHRLCALTAILFAAALACVAVLPVAGRAVAEPRSLKDQIVGTWIFVSSVSTRKDGTTYDRWGSNPKGIFMLDPDGRYSQILMRSEAGLFGAKTVFSFGTYTVDEASKTLVTQIEGGSLAKLVGKRQRRLIKSLTPDALSYLNLDGTSGTKIEAHWKRPR
jgi:hypothetical protein